MSTEPTNEELAKGYAKQIEQAQERREAKDQERLERHGQAAALASQAIEAEQPNGRQPQGFELDAQNQDSAEQRQERNEINGQQGVVCGRGRNPTLRLWPAIFSGEIDVFPSERRNMGQEIGR